MRSENSDAFTPGYLPLKASTTAEPVGRLLFPRRSFAQAVPYRRRSANGTLGWIGTGSRRRSGSQSSPVEESIFGKPHHLLAAPAAKSLLFTEDPLDSSRMKFKVRARKEDGGGEEARPSSAAVSRAAGGMKKNLAGEKTGEAGTRIWMTGLICAMAPWPFVYFTFLGQTRGSSLTRPTLLSSFCGRNCGLMRSLTRVPLISLS